MFLTSGVTLFIVLEFTGGYENKLCNFLSEKGCFFHKADPKKAYYYHKSLRIKGKTDKIDAIGLASFARERFESLALFQPLSPEEKVLKDLHTRRKDLLEMRTKETNRLKSPGRASASASSSINKVIDFLNQEIESIEKEIEDLIDKDKEIGEKLEVLQEIEGVGEKTARCLLAFFPELGRLSGRAIAALSGCAPFPKDSGTMKGYRSTGGSGRGFIKTSLFLAAMGASRAKKGFLSSMYKRLIEGGKAKKVALTAIMRKIVVIANAKMRDFYSQKAFEMGV